MSNKNHMFHLVEVSPWPILTSMNVMSLMSGIILMFNSSNNSLLLTSTFF